MNKANALVVACIGIIVLMGLFFSFYYKSDEPTNSHDYLNAVITLQRTGCFGTCPIYTVTIYGDGRVVYNGGGYVLVAGMQTSQISEYDVRGLIDEFFRIDYFSLQDEYTAGITDLPWTITSITIDGKTKEIRDYYGSPQTLRDLESRIDQVANTKIWVGP